MLVFALYKHRIAVSPAAAISSCVDPAALKTLACLMNVLLVLISFNPTAFPIPNSLQGGVTPQDGMGEQQVTTHLISQL